MTEGQDKTPVEAAVDHAVDLLVYAPIGLFFEGVSLLPQLIDRGKSQVSLARMVGRFAVRHRGREASQTATRLHAQATSLLGLLSDPGAVSRSPRPTTGASPSPAPVRTTQTRPAEGAARPATAGEGAARLAIPDYDGLSASQVVSRLGGLAPAELRAVRSYEETHRGRKTILSKAAQLQDR